MHHLLHVFATFVPAGPQVRTVKLVSAFGQAYRHTFVAMDGRTGAAELLPAELRFELRAAPPKAGTLRTVPRMRALLRELRPDLCLTYNFGALDTLFAARSLNLRNVVHHEDGFLPDEAHGLKRRRVWARRAAFGGAARVVVISRNLEAIAREHWCVPERKLAFIANGIDVESFAPADRNPALRAELGIPAAALVVGAVGHLRPEKNFARLLRAVHAAAEQPERPELHVLLLGEGPERAALESLTRELELGQRVHFAGHRADPRPWYREMDLFALTSDTEQAPIALLEAMATGLPVVATAVGDVAAMVSPQTRARVLPLAGPGRPAGAPAGSGEHTLIQRLAEQLSELAASPDVRASEGRAQAARARAEFSADNMLARYRALYDEVLAHSSG